MSDYQPIIANAIAAGALVLAYLSHRGSKTAKDEAATAASRAAAAQEQAAEAVRQAAAATAKANEIAEENLRLAHAQVEIEISNQIATATRRLQDFAAANSDFSLSADESKMGDVEKARHKRLCVLWGSIEEEYLNAYDEACQKYIDNKVDRTRFKDKYQRHVRNIAEDSTYDKYLRHGHQYAAFMTVYDEWENHEKKKLQKTP